MKRGSWDSINWKSVWRIVMIGYILLILTAGLGGWWIEGILNG